MSDNPVIIPGCFAKWTGYIIAGGPGPIYGGVSRHLLDAPGLSLLPPPGAQEQLLPMMHNIVSHHQFPPLMASHYKVLAIVINLSISVKHTTIEKVQAYPSWSYLPSWP